MKNNLENSFQQSLNNFEMPYNSEAWTSMSAKLDAKMPVKPTNTKWYVAAGVLLLAALTTSLFLFSGKENTNNPILAEESHQETIPQNSNENAPTSSVDSKNEKTQDEKNLIEKETKNTVHTSVSENESPAVEENNNVTVEEKTTPQENSIPSTLAETAPENRPIIAPEDLIIPSVSSVCVGEKIKVENINDSEIVIGGPWFQQIIAPHSSVVIAFKNEGTYVIGPEVADDGKNLKTFSVHARPDADFTVDADVKYEKGLPTIRLMSNSGQQTVWNYGKTTAHGDEINPHFFKKGNHSVQMTVTDQNGCSNSLEKDIYIEDNYNLLAVNSFIPQDVDIRRNTFMPFALTQRENVQFSLIILDPSDGHIVYQTSDVTAGWTGIDQQNGQAVKFEKAYIWKVIISNPEKEEKGEYAGTITPLTN